MEKDVKCQPKHHPSRRHENPKWCEPSVSIVSLSLSLSLLYSLNHFLLYSSSISVSFSLICSRRKRHDVETSHESSFDYRTTRKQHRVSSSSPFYFPLSSHSLSPSFALFTANAIYPQDLLSTDPTKEILSCNFLTLLLFYRVSLPNNIPEKSERKRESEDRWLHPHEWSSEREREKRTK